MDAENASPNSSPSPSGLPKVLIVDESRMVRSAIVKQVRDFYDFREEANGEAGWQAIVLDHSIQVVIASLSMPVLDGAGLLNRVRASRLQRIRELPMLMITGDDDDANERAKQLGASDFVRRGTGAAELLARIESLLKLSSAQSQLASTQEHHVQNPQTGLFTRKYIELQAVQAMSHALRHDSQVSAMVVGFDRFSSLRDEIGEEVIAQLQQRFSVMLASKIRKEDSLGHFAGSQLVVISPGTPYPACESFANRLRQAVAEAHIAAHGHRIALTVSVGVSNCPVDNVTSAGALVELAGARLKEAQQLGGNRVIACDSGSLGDLVAPSVSRAIELINSGCSADVVPHAAELARRLMPLMRMLEKELGLGLPMADLEKRLKHTDSTQESKDAGQP